jgi:hypothetical protein
VKPKVLRRRRKPGAKRRLIRPRLSRAKRRDERRLRDRVSNLRFQTSDINLVSEGEIGCSGKKKISDLRFEIANLRIEIKSLREIEKVSGLRLEEAEK